jgi:hypothetical protein
VEREDKQLEGPELARDQAFEQSQREEHDEEQLPELVTEEVRDEGFENRSRLFDALQLILAREHVNISLLYLPKRETVALEALQEAVIGSDTMGEFVFAEDRRMLLEQALAVLQQNLTYGDPKQVAELQNKYCALTGQIAELRGALTDLEDAQEEMEEFHAAHQRGTAGELDDDEKPKKADPGLVDFLAEALFAMAEVRPEAPSSLSHGPERKAPPAWKSTLEGAAIETPAPASSLYGERPEPPKQPSTLDGPALPEKPKPKSTLGDVVEQALSGKHDPAPQTRLVKKPEEPKK